MEKSLVYLVGQDGSAIPAELWDDISAEHVELWTKGWQPEINKMVERLKQDGVPREKWPQDLHWDWRKKADLTRGYLAYQRFTLICERQLQGLMLVNLTSATARLDVQRGKDMAYVDFVSTAPWNRPDFLKAGKPRFVGVGSVMIRVAVELSRAEGFRGRIGLHSLPQAERFYRKTCQMTDLGPDTAYYGLTYFEMTETQANAFITEPPRK